jgi:septum site-determining protein MinD
VAGRVITVTSGKGGVGKTTFSANVSAALAALGHKTVAVDTDVGLRNLDIVMGLENRIVFDLVDAVEGRCRVAKACIRDKRFNTLHLLPAAQTRDKSAVSPDAMKKVCTELRTLFDMIILDSPAGIERGFENAVAGADEVLIIATPHVSSIRDADRVIGLLEATEEKPRLRLVVNRLQPELVRRGEMLDISDMLEILSIELLGIIPEDEHIVVSSNRGELATLNAASQAGQAYKNIARRLMGEDVPLLPLENETGFFKRLTRMFRGH